MRRKTPIGHIQLGCFLILVLSHIVGLADQLTDLSGPPWSSVDRRFTVEPRLQSGHSRFKSVTRSRGHRSPAIKCFVKPSATKLS
jgi:hypothetical protein